MAAKEKGIYTSLGHTAVLYGSTIQNSEMAIRRQVFSYRAIQKLRTIVACHIRHSPSRSIAFNGAYSTLLGHYTVAHCNTLRPHSDKHIVSMPDVTHHGSTKSNLQHHI